MDIKRIRQEADVRHRREELARLKQDFGLEDGSDAELDMLTKDLGPYQCASRPPSGASPSAPYAFGKAVGRLYNSLLSVVRRKTAGKPR